MRYKFRSMRLLALAGAVVLVGGLVAVIAESGDDAAAIASRHAAGAARNSGASAPARTHQGHTERSGPWSRFSTSRGPWRPRSP